MAGDTMATTKEETTVGPSTGSARQPDPVSGRVLPVRPALRRWWDGRAGRQLLFEMALIPAGYYFYKWARHISQDEFGSAFDNARDIIRLESLLGIYNESALQELALRSDGLVRSANWFYANAHFWVTGVALILSYALWPHEYRRLRRGIISVTALALVIHVLYPLAPPRMFPGYGFVDTLEVFGPAIYSDSVLAGQANQIAAMPSLHFAYAVMVAALFVRVTPVRWRWLFILHPVATLLAIVVTANHFWLDAVVAGMLILAVAPYTAPAERPTPSALTPAPT